MLIFKNDYLTIDANSSEYFNSPEGGDYVRKLTLYFTIQCNGKIKRTQIELDVLKEGDDTAFSWSVNGLYISDYRIVYQLFQMLSDLGYDIPLNEQIHPLIDDALRLFNQ